MSVNTSQAQDMPVLINTRYLENWLSGWFRIANTANESHVVEMLKRGFEVKPSLAEVLDYCDALNDELAKVYKAIEEKAATEVGFSDSNICFTNFVRNMVFIKEPELLSMKGVLAECQCCERHMSRRSLAEAEAEAAAEENQNTAEHSDAAACKCPCRHYIRRVEEALANKNPLKINGFIW